VSFGADRPSGRAPPWSGRAPLEWSRATKITKSFGAGVVAPLPGGRAPWWSGRAPSKSSEIAETRPNRALTSLVCILLLQMHNEGLQRGKLSLYAYI